MHDVTINPLRGKVIRFRSRSSVPHRSPLMRLVLEAFAVLEQQRTGILARPTLPTEAEWISACRARGQFLAPLELAEGSLHFTDTEREKVVSLWERDREAHAAWKAMSARRAHLVDLRRNPVPPANRVSRRQKVVTL